MRRRIKATVRPAASSWRRRIVVFLVVLAVIQLVVHYFCYREQWHNFFHRKRTLRRVLQIQDAVLQVLDEYGIPQASLKEQEEWLEVEVPAGLPIIRVYVDIAKRASALDAELRQGIEDYGTGKVKLVLGYHNRVAMRLLFIRGITESRSVGEIALIIDDFGYSKGSLLKRFLDIPYDMTFSVIPGLPHSRDIAEQAYERGKEVIVHMPMEALQEEVEDKGYTLFVNQAKNEMRRRIRKALRAVPHAKGLNNHQGSRATVDETTMRVLMEELARSGHYFVDSRTNSESIATDIARSTAVSAAANRIFLDVNTDTEAVHAQMQKVADLARTSGRVIAIGHFRESTCDVLEEEVPKLGRLGFRFVTVGQLLAESD